MEPFVGIFVVGCLSGLLLVIFVRRANKRRRNCLVDHAFDTVLPSVSAQKQDDVHARRNFIEKDQHQALRRTDRHLVMNVFNQMAAASYQAGHPPDRRLYALSEYLQLSLLSAESPWITLDLECSLLSAYLEILSCAKGFSASLEEDALQDAHVWLRPHTLCDLVRAVFETCEPADGSLWRLSLHSVAEEARRTGRIVLSIECIRGVSKISPAEIIRRFETMGPPLLEASESAIYVEVCGGGTQFSWSPG